MVGARESKHLDYYLFCKEQLRDGDRSITELGLSVISAHLIPAVTGISHSQLLQVSLGVSYVSSFTESFSHC